METRSNKLEICEAKCRDLESQVRALQEELHLLTERQDIQHGLHDADSKTNDHKSYDNQIKKLTRQAQSSKIQANVLKSLADERALRLKEAHNSDDHTSVLINHRDTASDKRIESLEQSLASLRAEKQQLLEISRTLTTQNANLHNQIVELKNSKTFRAGRAIANSTRDIRAFIKTPLVLNRIRKEPNAKSDK